MNQEHQDQEIEVKFWVTSLDAVRGRLEELGAELVQPRVYELNLRFDDSPGTLTRSGQVLRLRRDHGFHLTYKGPGQSSDVAMRQEIEFSVDDFDAAWRFLEALGYSVVVHYEKYRTVYRLGKALVTLDEMPYGTFVEIEGPNPAGIKKTAASLALDWGRRIIESYLSIYYRLCSRLGRSPANLTFAEFEGLKFSLLELDLVPADIPL